MPTTDNALDNPPASARELLEGSPQTVQPSLMQLAMGHTIHSAKNAGGGLAMGATGIASAGLNVIAAVGYEVGFHARTLSFVAEDRAIGRIDAEYARLSARRR